jgi:hypothetical protein
MQWPCGWVILIPVSHPVYSALILLAPGQVTLQRL